MFCGCKRFNTTWLRSLGLFLLICSCGKWEARAKYDISEWGWLQEKIYHAADSGAILASGGRKELMLCIQCALKFLITFPSPRTTEAFLTQQQPTGRSTGDQSCRLAPGSSGQCCAVNYVTPLNLLDLDQKAFVPSLHLWSLQRAKLVFINCQLLLFVS